MAVSKGSSGTCLMEREVMNIAENQRRAAYFASAGFLAIAFIWGVAFVIVKNSLDYIPPVYLLAFRFTIAGGLLFAITFKRTVRAVREKPDMLKHGIFIGAVLFLSYLAQTVGLVYTTAGKNAFLTAIYVVVVPFIHWIRVRQKPDNICFIAAFLAMFGIGLISLNGDLTINKGDLLTLLCGVLFALQIEYLGKYSEAEDPVAISVLMMLFAAVFSWMAAPLIDGSITKVIFNSESIGGLLYLAVLSTMICFLIQSICQQYLRSSIAAIIMSAESVFGALSSAFFLNERMSAKVIFGCALLFFAIILAQADLNALRRKVDA